MKGTKQRYKEMPKNFLVLLFTLFLCLLLGELMVRIFWAAPKFKYPQTLHNRHEILGWEMIPNQKAYTWNIPVIINSYGLRDDEFQLKKNQNQFRILSLGDSVTFGVAVEGDKTYPNQLEAILNAPYPEKRFEVINTAVQRYYTYQELDYLKLKGLSFQPDLVILGFYINDLGVRPKNWQREYENSREKLSSALWQKVPFLMHIVKNSAFISFIRDSYLKFRSSLHAKQSLEFKLLNGSPDEKMSRLWQAAEEYIAEIQALGEQHNFKFLLVALPGVNQVIREFPNATYPSKLQEIAQKRNIPYINMLPTFKKHYNGDIRSLYFRYDGHPNASAHRIAAEAIYQALIDFKLAPVGK